MQLSRECCAGVDAEPKVFNIEDLWEEEIILMDKG